MPCHVSVIAKDGSVPVIGGSLPEDYQSRAAGAAKEAIASVAEGSGLRAMGSQSAQRLFESLLSALGFSEVNVTIKSSQAP